MNYALDALWWRLTCRQVRDLAAVLTAPPLWTSGAEWPVSELLGAQGFRFLLALDDAPQPLLDYLAAREPFGRRLGFYAEALLAFWLAHAPHCRLLAHNLPVRDQDGRSLGELDFIAEAGGRRLHIELACKYYGAASGRAQDLTGFDPADTLPGKAVKLQQQMAWPQHEAGKCALAAAGLAVDASVSVVRGMAFGAADGIAGAPLYPYGWHGVYRTAGEPLPEGRYYRLPRMSWLSPARVAEHELLSAEEAAGSGAGLLTKMVLRPDGFWHETERLMQAV